MKNIIIIILLLCTTYGFSQNNNKGKFYIYWGWNRAWYSNSDISFKGNNYDFSLEDVVAKDRQSKFEVDTYLNPANISIPQYNYRIGYFINNNYNISIGMDHMKYVLVQDQIVKISGNINDTSTIYNGTYSNNDIALKGDFLKFEHTDGLNYANIEFRRFDEILDLNKIKVNLTEGLGGGILYPRTNVTLLNNETNDEFHLAGFGLSGVAGLNVEFFRYFFLQAELKGGYINMPDIRTTKSTSDKAKQSFFFAQYNVEFGFTFNLLKKKNSPYKI